MAAHIEKDTLVELEYELNRKDILHFRSIVAAIPAPGEYLVWAPAPVEHGYVFKIGDRVDLYASLLHTGDVSHTLHIKTRVLSIEKTGRGSQLHLKKSGFESRILNAHFYMLRSKANILLETDNPQGGPAVASATVHAVTLNGIHLSTPSPLKESVIWKGTLRLNGYLFSFHGHAETIEPKNSLAHGSQSSIRFDDATNQIITELAGFIESIQKKYILSRTGLTLHEVFDRSDIQDAIILEHLVPRSRHRVVLDILELVGWLFLILASFDIALALPPDVDFFDRVFQLKTSIVWNQEQLRHVPFFFVMESIIFLSAFTLHQFIYYRGNTRTRWSLWVLLILSLLAFLSVRTRL